MECLLQLALSGSHFVNGDHMSKIYNTRMVTDTRFSHGVDLERKRYFKLLLIAQAFLLFISHRYFQQDLRALEGGRKNYTYKATTLTRQDVLVPIFPSILLHQTSIAGIHTIVVVKLLQMLKDETRSNTYS